MEYSFRVIYVANCLAFSNGDRSQTFISFMFLRSGTFKTPTLLPVEFGELLLESLLEVSEHSDSDASAQNQDIIAFSPSRILEEQLEQLDEVLGLQANPNMAKAGKSTISPSKFYGDGKEDVEKWIRSFERISTANQWNE